MFNTISNFLTIIMIDIIIFTQIVNAGPIVLSACIWSCMIGTTVFFPPGIAISYPMCLTVCAPTILIPSP
jgi:hypothetical protein